MKKMKKIMIFDTSILSTNMGDYIIMDSVNQELEALFSRDMFFHAPTHDKVSKGTYDLNKISDYSFVGGTNLLSSNMDSYNQWKINIVDAIFLKNIILMGVGWWQYQGDPNFYTKYLLKQILNKNLIHAVRDSQIERMLAKIGMTNVINTGCMTMWKLTPEHCQKIPRHKADNVIFTLTDYNKDLVNDQKLIDLLLNSYRKVYFWPQGSDDLEYLSILNNIKDLAILGSNLSSYDELLDDTSIDLDYVGTRLHAGIRALQKLKRTVILSIDNRAEEKSKDFNLKVLARSNIDELTEIIKHDFATEIQINEANINRWKKQFQ